MPDTSAHCPLMHGVLCSRVKSPSQLGLRACVADPTVCMVATRESLQGPDLLRNVCSTFAVTPFATACATVADTRSATRSAT
mmetsp:Transcript_10621/g.27248  ORF Transcript_10621/g.27248 Transcript_10621/m.27248 type:complete len:82 (-) Transcript_10621:538-783(-)